MITQGTAVTFISRTASVGEKRSCPFRLRLVTEKTQASTCWKGRNNLCAILILSHQPTQCSRVYLLQVVISAVRHIVSIRITRCISTSEFVLDQVNNIIYIDGPTAVGIARFIRIRWWAAREDVADQRHYNVPDRFPVRHKPLQYHAGRIGILRHID